MCWLLPTCPLRQPHTHAASPLKPSLRLSRAHSWITRTSPCSDTCNGHKFPVHNLRCLRMKLSSHFVMKCDFQSHDPTPIQGGNSVLIQLVFLCPGQALLCLFVIFYLTLLRTVAQVLPGGSGVQLLVTKPRDLSSIPVKGENKLMWRSLSSDLHTLKHLTHTNTQIQIILK